jgi:hypothetical protein
MRPVVEGEGILNGERVLYAPSFKQRIAAPVRGAQGLPIALLSKGTQCASIQKLEFDCVVLSSAAFVTTITEDICLKLGFEPTPLKDGKSAEMVTGDRVQGASLIRDLTLLCAGGEVLLKTVMVLKTSRRDVQLGLDFLQATRGTAYIEFGVGLGWMQIQSTPEDPNNTTSFAGPTPPTHDHLIFYDRAGLRRTVPFRTERGAGGPMVGAIFPSSDGRVQTCASCGTTFGGLKACKGCRRAFFPVSFCITFSFSRFHGLQFH